MVRTMDVTINTWDLAQAIEVESGVGTSHAERVLEFARGFLPKVRERTDHVRFAETAEIVSSEDPLELRDLAGEEPARAARLAARLAEWRSARDARAPAERVLVEPTEGQRDALRALGYVED